MKLLLNTETNTLVAWPRIDDEPVVGLDPKFLEMDVVQEEQPAYDNSTHDIAPTETIDIVNKVVTRGYVLTEKPPVVVDEVALKKARIEKKLEFYRTMLVQINMENEDLGFDATQIQQVMVLLNPIKEALSVGIVEGSLYLLQQIEPSAVYSAERKAAHVAMFQEFLATI
jgi:hypothetical protein